jgi:hypothetical protein
MDASMFLAMSKVTSFTNFLSSNGISSKALMMSFDFVPLIEASKVPFFPLPFLTVTNVYNSPCDTASSSILK